MNVAPGGLAGVFGALSIETTRPGAPAKPAQPARPAAPQAPAQQAAPGGFASGLQFARAVSQSQKAEAPLPPPNPNMPRGSLIDLKV